MPKQRMPLKNGVRFLGASMVFRSLSKMRSRPKVSGQRAGRLNSATMSRNAMLQWLTRFAEKAPSSSGKQTFRAGQGIFSLTTNYSELPTTRGICLADRGDRRVERPRRWRWGSPPSRSVPTSEDLFDSRPPSTVCGGTNRASGCYPPLVTSTTLMEG